MYEYEQVLNVAKGGSFHSPSDPVAPFSDFYTMLLDVFECFILHDC